MSNWLILIIVLLSIYLTIGIILYIAYLIRDVQVLKKEGFKTDTPDYILSAIIIIFGWIFFIIKGAYEK